MWAFFGDATRNQRGRLVAGIAMTQMHNRNATGDTFISLSTLNLLNRLQINFRLLLQYYFLFTLGR
jgi:hypothetical protein